MITATKTVNGTECKNDFSDDLWKMLGKDKDGWVEVPAAKPEAVAKAEQEAKEKAEAVAKAK
jgi:hypothetical protein